MAVVFDRKPRTLIGPATEGMPQFSYLNDSSRPEAERVRSLIEELVGHIPASAQPDIVARLRSRRDVDHISAFFEVILHEMFIRDGCVITLHPEISGSSNRPDFLVTPAEGAPFYLEARLVSGRTAEEVASDRRLAQALDVINRRKSPDYFVNVSYEGSLIDNASARKISDKLEAWLKSLDYDAVCAAWNNSTQDTLALIHEEAGIRFEFVPVPKKTRGKTEGHRLVGAQIPPAEWSSVEQDIRTALSEKASRYGTLAHPYAIALNVFDEFTDSDSMNNALFGSDIVVVNKGADGEIQHRESRKPDGFWYGTEGPVHTRVSAVLWTSQLRPWSLAQRTFVAIHNPWARQPLNRIHPNVSEQRVNADKRFVRTAGEGVAEIFGLTPNWPIEEP